MKFDTKAVHAGVEPDPSTGAIMTPIFQTSTYVQSSPGDHKGYEYSRGENPTRDALEASLAALEGAGHAFTFSSGLAAVDAVARLLKAGDEVISTNDLYGGTFRLFTKFYEPLGIKFTFVNLNNAEDIRQHITDKTKLVWLETPTNPLINVIDIQAIVSIAKETGAMTVVDNTFATPYLQQPLSLGADIVLHSITKYLGGHSDVVMGCLMLNDDEIAAQLKFIQFAIGAVTAPMDCFLVLRGIKTLHLRVERACQNAEKITHWLNEHPKVGKVYWPGLETHPNHDVAAKQMKLFGGMLSFTLKDDSDEAALKVLSSTKVIALAESLGGVESLICHPATMTHASIPREVRLKAGLSDSLIRVSVGVEDADDLIADLERAIG